MRAHEWMAVLGVALALSVSSSGSAAPGVEPPDTGGELKRQGDVLFDASRFEDALVMYRKSFVLHPNPALLYNQGRCHETLGRYPEAIDAYNHFWLLASPELKAKVPNLKQQVDELGRKIAKLMVRSNVKGATITFRDRDVGVTPLSAPIRLVEGEGTLKLSADGYKTSRQTVLLQGGTDKMVDISLRSLVVAQPQTTSLASRWWFWTAIAGAVAGGVAVTIAATTERAPDEGTMATIPAPLQVAW